MNRAVSNLTAGERSYMNDLIAFMDSLIIKCDYDANIDETIDSKRAGEAYILAKNGEDSIFDYDIYPATLVKAGLSQYWRGLFAADKQQFYTAIKDEPLEQLLSYLRQKRINEYVEENDYYCTLAGEPSSKSKPIMIDDIFSEPIYKTVTRTIYNGDGTTSEIEEQVLKGYEKQVALHEAMHSPGTDMYAYLVKNNMEEYNKILAKLSDKQKAYEYIEHITKPIDYATARSAANFEIIWYDESLMADADVTEFMREYNDCRDYILTVPYNQAYGKNYELYDRYIVITILFTTLLHFVAKKSSRYIKRNFATREEKIMFLKDYDMDDVIDELTTSQLDKLIDNLDYLVSIKGSEQVIDEILKIFDITDINVYKYALIKTVNTDNDRNPLIDETKKRKDNYGLNLIQVPVNTKESMVKFASDVSNYIDPFSTMVNDKYVGGTNNKESQGTIISNLLADLKNNENFSWFYTKYIGIISTVNIMRCFIKSTYLIQHVMRDEDALGTMCTIEGLVQKFSVRDIFAAINYVISLRYDVADTIPTSETLGGIIAFNDKIKSDELKELEIPVMDFVDANKSDKDVSKKLVKVSEILEDEWFNVPRFYYEGITKDFAYNMKLYEKFIEELMSTKDIDRYNAVKAVFDSVMTAKAVDGVFGEYGKYSQYLSTEAPKLFTWITDYIQDATGGNWNVSVVDSSRNMKFIKAEINLVSMLIDAFILGLNCDEELSNAVKNTWVENTSIFARIFAIINLFKSYTVQLIDQSSNYIIDTPKDTKVRVYDMLSQTHGDDEFKTSLVMAINHVLNDFEGNIEGTTEVKLKYWLDEHNDTNVVLRIKKLRHELVFDGIEKLITNVAYSLEHRIESEGIFDGKTSVKLRDYLEENPDVAPYEVTAEAKVKHELSVPDIEEWLCTRLDNIIEDKLEEEASFPDVATKVETRHWIQLKNATDNLVLQLPKLTHGVEETPDTVEAVDRLEIEHYTVQTDEQNENVDSIVELRNYLYQDSTNAENLVSEVTKLRHNLNEPIGSFNLKQSLKLSHTFSHSSEGTTLSSNVKLSHYLEEIKET